MIAVGMATRRIMMLASVLTSGCIGIQHTEENTPSATSAARLISDSKYQELDYVWLQKMRNRAIIDLAEFCHRNGLLPMPRHGMGVMGSIQQLRDIEGRWLDALDQHLDAAGQIEQGMMKWAAVVKGSAEQYDTDIMETAPEGVAFGYAALKHSLERIEEAMARGEFGTNSAVLRRTGRCYEYDDARRQIPSESTRYTNGVEKVLPAGAWGPCLNTQHRECRGRISTDDK